MEIAPHEETVRAGFEPFVEAFADVVADSRLDGGVAGDRAEFWVRWFGHRSAPRRWRCSGEQRDRVHATGVSVDAPLADVSGAHEAGADAR